MKQFVTLYRLERQGTALYSRNQGSQPVLLVWLISE